MADTVDVLARDPFGRRRWVAPVAVAVVALTTFALAVTTAGFTQLPSLQTHSFHGLRFEPPMPAADFTLTSQDGQAVRLSDYRGQLVVLVFGYTHCPDACPTTLAALNRALEELGEASRQVQVVLVSVDPEQDTPAVLKEYLSRFNPAFAGLTGRPEAIEAVTTAYGVLVETEEAPAGSHLVAHATLTFVVDRNGERVLAFPLGMTPQEMAADLTYLLK